MNQKLHTPNAKGTHITQRFLRDEPAFVTSLDFGPFVAQGVGSGPSVLIGDQAEINLITSIENRRLDHRMALLAQNNDFVLVRKREAEFEAYLAECLALENLHFLEVNDGSLHSVARQARTSDTVLKPLVDAARTHQGLTLKAYLTTGNVWRLAQAIGEMSGQIIHVCGPSPRTTRRANDKLWFTEVARQVIGPRATPPTLSAYGPAAAAGLVRRISKMAEQVIVKVPDSAGSAGNIRLEKAHLDTMTLAEIRQLLMSRLHAVGWHDIYPILVGVWDAHVTHSPSAQLWVPKAGEGAPIVEGIFEQHVQGGTAAFAGAAQSVLPPAIQTRLSAEALGIADVLQHLGYFGRCSFDAVICQVHDATDVIHWIECNGRWGGVSIPMTAAGQLVSPTAKTAISIAQETVQGSPMHTAALRKLLGDLMFNKGRRDRGIVILSPPESARGVSVNLLAIGDSQEAADDMLGEAMQRLVAL